MPELTNPRAERVRSVRALAGRPVRDRRGLFLVEGPQPVREAVRHMPERVRDLYLTVGAAERYPEILAAARGADVPVWLSASEVLDTMSRDAQGVLAVVRTWSSTIDELVHPRLVAVLAAVRDPGNAGTVIRTADAAGASAVILAGASVDLFNPKVVRSTAGSLFHLPVMRSGDLPEVLVSVRGLGLQVLAADGGGALDLDDLLDAAASDAPAGTDLRAPTAWLFGNEAWGLPAEDVARADGVVRIPLRGAAESLNLATAAALCLYASARAQR
ncbi:RNA methyltransferase [Isoptericola sp. b441]|uniref:RNA methyltransferase n=1 Tax=Actinotalea lenta TaxID=3064654 RepID=A0ABT9DA63_9CELL|nr:MULTISPECIES: RNA methyltransferase [unclassified Isoptericola]MDO8107455.1 RNA methyltransferase [Isoptericola sp. b441]MDO8120884.1 RNA methyltransferase [Isoptericola sp. b490]